MDQFFKETETAMNVSTKIRPENSLLFISDRDGGTPPEPVRGPMILATPTCVSFRCYPEQDGPTVIVLGDAREIDPGNQPEFDDDLETPNRVVVISTVGLEKILQMNVAEARTRIRIWLSHRQWPEKVVVGLG
jgi:hypothetical protein